jgi:hypothetical protein
MKNPLFLGGQLLRSCLALQMARPQADGSEGATDMRPYLAADSLVLHVRVNFDLHQGGELRGS